MKVRSGFVSNSSSTSFSIYGTYLDNDEIKKLLKVEVPEDDDEDKEVDEEEEDDDGDGYEPDGEDLSELLEKKLEKSGLTHYYSYESECAYIGRDWETIKDDETGKEFKTGVEEKLKKVFGTKVKCESHTTEISS